MQSIFLADRGWVGWKRTPEREAVEILFEFDAVREFHAVHVFANNQFTRDVAVFKSVSVAFSVGGEIFSGDPVVNAPLEDAIFEEPRNVTAKLHRRIGKFVRVRMEFASKWIMISEVAFDSSVARGNYTAESEEEDVEEAVTAEAPMLKDQGRYSVLS